MGTSVLGVLTNQHQQDLQQCNRLMNDIEKQGNRKAVQEDILRFWNNVLQKHVLSEDKVLMPFLVRHHFNHGYVEMLRREHDTLRVLAQRLPMQEEGSFLYKAFIRLVEQHIEFEDKILFKKIKEEIPEGELKQLEQQFEV